MARLVRNTKNMILGFKLTTVFEDGSVSERKFKLGDTIENLRYVKDEEVIKVSGKIIAINFTMPTKITYNPKNPSNTLVDDVALTTLVLDASTLYESNIVTIPFEEIVEFEDEHNVVRMKYESFVTFDMELYYSDLSLQKASVEVGDVFNNVRIINPNDIGNDYVGKYSVLAFIYELNKAKTFDITGIAFKNEEDGSIIATNLEYILSLNEVYTYGVNDPEEILSIVSELKDGDTITISNVIDNSEEKGALVISGKKDISVVMNEDFVTANSANSIIRISSSEVEFTGTGKVKAVTPYDSSHAKTVVRLDGDSVVTFNGSGVDSVLPDSNQGQFGLGVFDNAKLIINDGDFKAGWFALSSNGTFQNNNGEVTINGGDFSSAYDFCLYFPANYKYTINGGRFDGPAGCISINAGELYINGGTFTTSGEGSKVTETYSQDGTYNSKESCINLNAKYNNIKCRITGGTFISGDHEAMVITIGDTHTVDLKISGGKFSKPITNPDWLEIGYVCSTHPGTDGLYEVIKIS